MFFCDETKMVESVNYELTAEQMMFVDTNVPE